MKKIETTAWQTSDGRLFFDEQEAKDVELKLSVLAWTGKYWNLGYDATQDEVAEWLIDNRHKLMELFNG